MTARRDDHAYYELQQLRELAHTVACSYCGAAIGEHCVRPGMKHDQHHEHLFHPRRLVDAQRARDAHGRTPHP